ncbi:sulfatase/phosphatase domain-containing protein [Sphingobacterium sp. JUb21]|uniref:sulfatase/phosphatase domain-containing protein n=1 Tax=Sphingobacterium sp. JUb21 TaxID=2940616 RepID=UPI0038F759E7
MKRGTGHLIDIAPTLYDYAQAKYPNTNYGTATNTLPGVSLRKLLNTDLAQVERNQALFWERAGNRAVRFGKWKLVSTYRNGNNVELYDIDTDRGENHNVASQNPQVVKQLEELYRKWAKENDVVNYDRIKGQSSFR